MDFTFIVTVSFTTNSCTGLDNATSKPQKRRKEVRLYASLHRLFRKERRIFGHKATHCRLLQTTQQKEED